MGRFLANLFNRRFWLRGGLTEDEYEEIRPLINQRNYESWKTASIMMLIYFAFVFATTFTIDLVRPKMVIYIVMLLLSVVSNILFIYVLKPESKFLMPWIYFVVIMLFVFAVFIGVVNFRDQVAVTIMVLLVALPMLVLGKPYIMSIIIAVSGITFAICSYFLKTSVARQMDIYDALWFCVLSEFVHVYSMGNRLQGYKMQSIVEKNLSTDGLTKVKNKTAYIKLKSNVDSRIVAKKSFSFGVVVCDINTLKAVNDKYGHEVGDVYIRTNCKALCSIFAQSPVYRIGGDEFLVYLEGESLEKKDEYMAQLDKLMNTDFPNIAPQDKIDFAYGYSTYDPDKDQEFSDVFVRADEAMYALKAHMHEKSGVNQNN